MFHGRTHFAQAKQRKGSEHWGGGGATRLEPGDRANVTGTGQRDDLEHCAVEKPGVALGSPRDTVEICPSCSCADSK